MSMRLPAAASALDGHASDGSGSSSDTGAGADEEETWSDWVSDGADARARSLFDESTHDGAAAALAHDAQTHGFDLDALVRRLDLDFHGRARLINYIRKQKPPPADLNKLTGQEPFFTDDEYLVPALENDPLLRQADAWSSSSEDEDDEAPAKPPADLPAAARRIRRLEARLRAARADLAEYRRLVHARADVSALHSAIANDPAVPSDAGPRDDDTAYFESYGANDIHAVMIQDKVRTSAYASFILTHPGVFRDKVVLDVGCGTGILSLFAAQAGAKHVYAVDASGVARRARQIVKANGYEDTVTVIQGKIEDIALPVDKVDVIVSEWMGYALLYEAMLDSVLRARDRFLAPGGLLVPSQSRIMLALCAATEIHKERVAFWNDVYGFEMGAMAEEVFGEAVVDVTGPETVLSAPACIKDLYLKETHTRDLDFAAPFTLTSTAERKTKIHALVLYFDTFFHALDAPVPATSPVDIVRPDGDASVADVFRLGRRPSRRSSQGVGREVASFSTGPLSAPTHWKQALFLLREPVLVDEGTVVQGSFSMRKSADNSRELDVEIRYTVRESEGTEVPAEAVVQVYKVR